jgi:RNA polymerase sigma factor (sigma-70 family)
MAPVETGLAKRTDEQLVMDARAALAFGDPKQSRRCAGLLWIRLEPRLRLRIARRVPRDEVDDVCNIVAEQFIGYVYRSADVPRSAAAIAFAIADRRVADRTRVSRNAATPVAEIDLPGALDSELEAALDRAVADQLFASLDERSAAVMRRSLAGEAAEEIARDLKITRSHLDVIAHRARKRLMQVLEGAR